MASSIKAIISDLGGVLVHYDKLPLCRQIAKYSPFSAKEIASHFSNTRLTEEDIDFGKGIISPLQYYERMCSRLKLSGLDFGHASRIYNSGIVRKDDSIKLLRKLAGKYAMALLSNTNILHFEKCKTVLGEDMSLFKEVILSFEVHNVKPSREIYLEAISRLKLKPHECVYIDDIEEYVAAAARLGMHGIQFTSAAKLETDLKKLGVSF